MTSTREPPGPPAWAGRRAVRIAALLLASALALWAVLNGMRIATGPSQAPMTMVSPGGAIGIEDVPPALVGHYEAAQVHYSTFEKVPCFCGCEEMLAHRHLGDCFIRSEGQGLEAHALGCGVCIGEAAQVEGMIAAGSTDPESIRAAVIAEWGDPYSDQ